LDFLSSPIFKTGSGSMWGTGDHACSVAVHLATSLPFRDAGNGAPHSGDLPLNHLSQYCKWLVGLKHNCELTRKGFYYVDERNYLVLVVLVPPRLLESSTVTRKTVQLSF
jgi:hypothetical protein